MLILLLPDIGYKACYGSWYGKGTTTYSFSTPVILMLLHPTQQLLPLLWTAPRARQQIGCDLRKGSIVNALRFCRSLEYNAVKRLGQQHIGTPLCSSQPEEVSRHLMSLLPHVRFPPR